MTTHDKIEIGLTFQVTAAGAATETIVIVAEVDNGKYPFLAVRANKDGKYLGTMHYTRQGICNSGLANYAVPLSPQAVWMSVDPSLRMAFRALKNRPFDEVKEHFKLAFPNNEQKIYDALQSGTLS